MGYNGGMSADDKKARAKPKPPEVKTVKEFTEWVDGLEGLPLLYRGLANTEWQVECAAHRRIEASETKPNIRSVRAYISRLLKTAHMYDHGRHEGRKLHNLELMALLQHAGAATCLIDFTHNPLVALWFACREELDDVGKVVVMNPKKKGATISGLSIEHSQPSTVIRTVDDLEELDDDIESLLDGKTLQQWIPIPRGNRVIAQQSVFVFGQAVIKNYDHEVRISSLAKNDILRVLHEKFGINEVSLFGDFAGFALANAHDKPYEEYSADEYYEFAESSFERGDKAKAVQYCDKAIEEDPRHLNAYSLRGWCNYFRGESQESADDFSHAIEIDDTNMQFFMARAMVYAHGLKKPEKAVRDYTVVINSSSTSENEIALSHLPDAYRFRGLAYAKMGEHEDAIADFTSALEIQPDWTDVYFDRAKSHRALGNESEARADESRAEVVRQRRRQRFARNDDRRDHRRPRDE